MKYQNWRESHLTVLQTLSSPKNRTGLTVQELADHTNVPLAYVYESLSHLDRKGDLFEKPGKPPRYKYGVVAMPTQRTPHSLSQQEKLDKIIQVLQLAKQPLSRAEIARQTRLTGDQIKRFLGEYPIVEAGLKHNPGHMGRKCMTFALDSRFNLSSRAMKEVNAYTVKYKVPKYLKKHRLDPYMTLKRVCKDNSLFVGYLSLLDKEGVEDVVSTIKDNKAWARELTRIVLKEYLQTLSLSAIKVCQAAGVHRSALSVLFNDKGFMGKRGLLKILKVMGLTWDELMDAIAAKDKELSNGREAA